MKIHFDRTVTQNYEQALQKEWLETNGLGGYAGSTIIGANTRRYHGLLVAATQPPVGRMVLLSKLEETVAVKGQRFELGCNRYPNAVHPTGFRFLHSFTKNLFPVFTYKINGITIRKTICAVQAENTILILYEIPEAAEPFVIELNPLIAGRDFHSLTHANSDIRSKGHFRQGIFNVQPYHSLPELFIAVQNSDFHPDPRWYYNFKYSVEQFRGLDFREDLFSYGKFTLPVKSGEKFGVIVSTENPGDRDPFALLQKEKRRRRKLITKMPVKDDLTRLLFLATDQFVVKRGRHHRSIIAGYHWFADWGRDTMIALPGICLVTGRFSDARKILQAFAGSISQGMLPNRFPDVGETPEYNTVDATLWFFVAIHKYLIYTGDLQFVKKELLPVLLEIIAWHRKGTRYKIHVDRDGLLYAGEPGVQLTWMDAKIGDWVVTPRRGKAVEVNALWFNALRILSEILKKTGQPDEAEIYLKQANQVRENFRQTFWNERDGYLYDYVNGTHHDQTLRPNQIFALSLPFPLLEKTRAKKVLRIVEEKLYTPFGLRSLSPDHPDYRPNYGGDQLSRDSAYHQGTVWSWLLGPFITALVRYYGEPGRKRAQKLLERIIPHFSDGCVGSVSEIFDAESPYSPRGAVAQAWSVAEILRAYVEDILNTRPKNDKAD